MPRGGKRIGAGRKPVLDVYARIWIGTECQNRMDETARYNAHSRLIARRKRRALGSRRFRMEQVPGTNPILKLYELYAELAKVQPKRFTRRQEVNSLVCQIRRLKVSMRGPRTTSFLCAISAPVVRPRNRDRFRILEEVAAMASQRYGVTVLPSMVDLCWKEFRREILRHARS